jgi:hypothetical protein
VFGVDARYKYENFRPKIARFLQTFASFLQSSCLQVDFKTRHIDGAEKSAKTNLRIASLPKHGGQERVARVISAQSPIGSLSRVTPHITNITNNNITNITNRY